MLLFYYTTKKPKKQRIGMKNKKILIYFILSIVFFFYGYYILKMFNISIFPLFIYLFINFFIGIVLTVVIHELGHVFAGLMNGYKFYGFQFLTTRSEERRVGKECRSRWSPYH